MIGGIAVGIVIPFAKIARYLLDLDHPTGGSKARFFIGQGFSPERPKELADALRAHLIAASTQRVGQPHPHGFGTVVTAKGDLVAPTGRALAIVSIWNHPGPDDPISFVTAYPS